MICEKIVTSTTWSPGPGCHGGCGIKLHVKDGKVVKAEGDENHPFNQGRLCPRALALTQYIYHPDRITHPLKRASKRGEGKFERITWDEALDIIEKKLREIKEKYGPESVLFCQGTGRDIGGPISFLAYSYGSPNWIQLGLAGHSCYTPRLGAMMATLGDYTVLDAGQFLEKRYDDPEYEFPKVIMIWAQNPMAGCPDGFFGHWIVDCMKHGSKLIVIDPRWTWFASRAEKFLRIRPGTDGALAMAMINVIINEELYNKEFVEKWTYGFEELKKRAEEYTPEKVSEIIWVPKEDIIEAARLYAKNSPAAIHWGVPVDMNPEGSTVAQAITHLYCLTGNVDIPGGNVIARAAFDVTTYPFSTQEMHQLYGKEFIDRMNEKRIGTKEYQMVRNFRGWAQPDIALEQMLSGKPYPIKAAWIQTSNPLGGQAADLQKHYEAMKKLDFVVVADLFHTPTTMAVADIILPVATFAEKESFRSWWSPLNVIVPAVEVGECRSDWEINLELARRFNPELARRYKTVKDLINSRLEPSGMTYDEIKEAGCWAMSPKDTPERPYRRYEKGLLRPDGKPGFRTPTGKIEFYSKSFESWGLDPLPYYSEPPESEIRTPELFKKYPLIMVTGRRSSLFFHAEHRNIPWLRECEPDPLVEVNPKTAAELGVNDGEWVYIENDRGRIKRRVKTDICIHPKTISVPHGWWLPEEDGKEPNLFGIWDINCNKLVPMGTQGKSGYGGGAYKTTLVRLIKIGEGEE